MIKFKTLRRRIFTILASVIIVVAGSIAYYLLYDLKTRYYNSFDNVTMAMNNALVANIRESIYKQKYDNMLYILDQMQSPYIKNIIILDSHGTVIATQNETELLGKPFRDYSKLLASPSNTLKNNQQHTILNRFEIMEIVSGYLVLEGNREYYLAQLNEELNGLLIMIISFFILTLSIAFYLSKYISKPLYTIIKTMRSTDHNEKLVFKEESEEEFAYLTETIAQKHNELLLLNLDLEAKIEAKIIELRQLNESLEQKVKEAVDEAQHKEILLHKQTRLAQMGEMVSMIAHQWRQPLAAITSTMMVVERYIETDKFELQSNPKGHEFIQFINTKHEHIYNNIEYLSSTTDDFREFFNPHTTKLCTAVNEPIEKAIKLIEKSITNNGIQLHIKLDSKEQYTFYPNEIMQVILNLIKNASDALIEHKVPNKTLWVESYDTPSEIIIKVRDNGIGIKPEAQEHIFDPYFSTKVQKIGTGLGLYMSKNIIEEHNSGSLFYTQEEGTTCFIIRFPIKD